MEIARKSLTSIGLVVLGSFILAFGTYNFNYQNDITEGGVLGLLLLLKNLFDFSPALTGLVLDVILFIVGWKFFGKTFLFYSIVSTTAFSAFYYVLEQFDPIVPMLDNMLAASLLAGLFVGIGVGLVVKGGGAAGGDDVIALVVSNSTKLNLSQVYMIMDVTVLSLSLVYLNVSQIFWSLIAVYTSSKVISLIYYSNSNNDAESKENTGKLAI